MEEDKIELYSEEVEDLLGTPPRALVRWGTTVLFLVIGALITLSAVVDYPDKVIAPITITTPYPPSPVITRTEGNLSLMDYENGSWIEEGSILGIIKNPANEEDILALEKEIKNIEVYKPIHVLDFKPKQKLQLGSLQSLYSDFSTLFESYIIAFKASFDFQKIEQLEEQIQNIQNLNTKIQKNQLLVNQALQVSKERLDRKAGILKGQVIAQDEYDEANAKYLTDLQNKENGAMAIKKNNLLVNEINREITTIKKGIQLEENSSFVELTESIKKLEVAIKTWKENYLITASIAGKISFDPKVKSKMYVSKEMAIAMILPKEDDIMGKIDLAMKGAGKVNLQNDVIIKFDSYPYQEYGFVRGSIKHKSAFPRDNKFYVEVELPNKLQTSRGDILDFQPEIQGIAEIITDKRSLLSRIFDQILTALELVKET